jgi:hypothetical protein
MASLVKHLISVWDDQKFTILICRARPRENVRGRMNLCMKQQNEIINKVEWLRFCETRILLIN